MPDLALLDKPTRRKVQSAVVRLRGRADTFGERFLVIARGHLRSYEVLSDEEIRVNAQRLMDTLVEEISGLRVPDAALREPLKRLAEERAVRGIPPEVTRANLSAILDELARRNVPVLLSGMYAPPNLGPDYGRQFRAVFDALGRRPGVLYDPFFLEGVAGEAELNQPDRIHPGPEGVRRIVARLLPLVLELVGKVGA